MSRGPRLTGSGVRFLIAGATTTFITLGLYLLLLQILPYALAYSVVFVVGIGISYVLNSTFVFRATTSVRTLALFPLIYVVQYGVGLAVVTAWVDVLGLPEALASLAAIAVTIPLTYLLARLLFSGQQPTADSER